MYSHLWRRFSIEKAEGGIVSETAVWNAWLFGWMSSPIEDGQHSGTHKHPEATCLDAV